MEVQVIQVRTDDKDTAIHVIKALGYKVIEEKSVKPDGFFTQLVVVKR